MNRTILSLPSLQERPHAEWKKNGWWGQDPLWKRVLKESKAQPEKLAVIDEKFEINYSELWRESVVCASALKHLGLERGNIALIQLPNWNEFCSIMIGCELANVIFAFCPVTWGVRECTRALELLKPSVWFTVGNYQGDDRTDLINSCVKSMSHKFEVVLLRSENTAFRHWSELTKETKLIDESEFLKTGGFGTDPLEIAVTSGTTGNPKGVIHSHDTALSTVQSTIDRQDIKPDDVILLPLPVGHTFGYFYGVRCALQIGATLILQERWDVIKMAELVAAHGVTITLGTAALVIDMMNVAESDRKLFSSIRLFTQSGDNLTKAVIEKAVKILPFRISRALGMTEFGHVASTDEETPIEKLIVSVGTAQKEIEIVIKDDQGKKLPVNCSGRILVKGPAVCAGYLKQDGSIIDVLDENGFFDTGDLGSLDDERFLRITGRNKNILRRGAETIPLSDLEEILCSHPDIIHAVVIGIPDERLGDLPLACVQIFGGKSLDIGTIRLWFETKGITRKFWPTDMHVVEEWPKGPTGKIDARKLLRDYLEAK